jgi:hypothetical protein
LTKAIAPLPAPGREDCRLSLACHVKVAWQIMAVLSFSAGQNLPGAYLDEVFSIEDSTRLAVFLLAPSPRYE